MRGFEWSLADALRRLRDEGAITDANLAWFARRQHPVDRLRRFLVDIAIEPRGPSIGRLRAAVREIVAETTYPQPRPPSLWRSDAVYEASVVNPDDRTVARLLERQARYLPGLGTALGVAGLLLARARSLDEACLNVDASPLTLFEFHQLACDHALSAHLGAAVRDATTDADFDAMEEVHAAVKGTWIERVCPEVNSLSRALSLKDEFRYYADLAGAQGAWIKPVEFDRAFLSDPACLPLHRWRLLLAERGTIELSQEKPGAFWFMRGRHGRSACCQRKGLLTIVSQPDFWP